MIDFSKITKTIGGLDCYYLGQRLSYSINIHRFAVVNGHSERFCYYNDAGKRVDFIDGKWSEAECLNVDKDLFQIIAPPKIVEVTRWFRLEYDEGCRDNCYVEINLDKPNLTPSTLDIQKHTFRFEVPNDS